LSDAECLDDSHPKGQYSGMKYLGLSVLTLLFVLGVETSAQDNPFNNRAQEWGNFAQPVPNQASCPDYKIVIVTPSKDVDFKMKLLAPSKNIDPGIVFKPCAVSNQLSLAPQVFMPPLGTNGLSTGNVFMSGNEGVFISGQGNVFMPGKIK
jgi:hypothetical protein